MTHFIIIRGPLGVGKTTIAKKLARILSAEYLSIDKVLSEHGLDKVEGDCITAESFIKGNDIVIPRIQKSLFAGTPVIIDGCFYHKEQIEHFADKLSAPHFIFTLKAPVEVCIERDAGRDLVYGKDVAQAVYNLVSKFDYGIAIDTKNKTADEVVGEITAYIE